MTTRDLSNQRVTLWLGSSVSVANLAAPTIAEVTAMLNVSPAVRWNGFSFNASASNQVDDRSLDDAASAKTRGFAQFGGDIPFYYPKVTDTTSILRQTFNLVKAQGTGLIVVERIGFKSTSAAIAAGDNVNVYRVLTDGFKPDTAGDGGYAYVITMLPQGDIYPWTIIPAVSPATVAIVGGATLAITVGNAALRGATYQGNDITARGTWASSDATKATVVNGRIYAVAAGTCNVTCTFPGGTISTAVAVTVS